MAKQKSVGVNTKGWEKSMEDFFLKKLPALPTKAKEFIVKYSPWIALVVIICCLPTMLMAFGLWSILAPISYMGVTFHYGYDITWWLSVASTALSIWALPGLFKRKAFSWKLMFYSSLVMGVYYLLSFNLGGLVIGTGMSLYILFQIKSYYK